MSTNDPQSTPPPPLEPPPIPPQPVQYATPAAARSGREQYNVIADTVVGPNFRVKDNIIQAIVIAVCLVIGLVIGAAYAPKNDRAMGMAFGAIGGLLVGLFGSGIFLMIYRAVRHMRGRHD